MKNRLGRDTFLAIEPPSRWWDSERLSRLREDMRSTLESGQILILLGATGVGKTTELMRLIQSLAPDWITCSGTATENAVLSNLAHSLSSSLIAQGVFRKTNQPDELIRALFATGRRPLVVIDDAHIAPEQWLEDVLALHASAARDAPFGLVLAGTEGLLDKLTAVNHHRDAAGEEREIWKILTLPPWEPGECEEYLRAELAAAGCGLAAALDNPEVLAGLNRDSGGIPRQLRKLARARLEDAEREMQRLERGRERMRALGLGGGALGFLVLSMLAGYLLMPRLMEMLGDRDTGPRVEQSTPVGTPYLATLIDGRVIDAAPPFLQPWLQERSIVWSQPEQRISVPVTDLESVVPDLLPGVLTRIAELLNSPGAEGIRVEIEIPHADADSATSIGSMAWPDSTTAEQAAVALLQTLRDPASRTEPAVPAWLLEELRAFARPQADEPRLSDGAATDPAVRYLHVRLIPPASAPTADPR